jgi:hypothetical protein
MTDTIQKIADEMFAACPSYAGPDVSYSVDASKVHAWATAISALAAQGGGVPVFWAYFKPPFRFVERDETYYVEDSNEACRMRVMLMWPAHPSSETEAAEIETRRLGELFADAANAAHRKATAAILSHPTPAALDAERYRWLVSSGKFVPAMGSAGGWALGCGAYAKPSKQELDAAIDATRATTGGNGNG